MLEGSQSGFYVCKASLPVERFFFFAVVYVVRGFVRFDGFGYALLPRGPLGQILHSCVPSAYASEQVLRFGFLSHKFDPRSSIKV